MSVGAVRRTITGCVHSHEINRLQHWSEVSRIDSHKYLVIDVHLVPNSSL